MMSKQDKNYIEEVTKLQNSTELLIQKQPFMRLLREVTYEYLDKEYVSHNGIRFQARAVEALQTATEALLVTLLEDCDLLAKHANRVTVRQKDMQLARRLTRRRNGL